MTTINLEKAQQDFAGLIERALAGEEIVIEADSRKVRLAPVPALQYSTRRPRAVVAMVR
jgi:antitoxin (DNA-binding transcriptional repressor) of toxin-antitoxin stability system